MTDVLFPGANSAPAVAMPALDPAGLKRIAGGVSADVYHLDHHRVLKLLHPDIPEAVARRELAATCVAAGAGLAIASPHGLVTVGMRSGLILERLDEHPLARRIRRWPGAVMGTLAAMARYQADIHKLTPAAGLLPQQRDVMAHRLTESLAGAAAVDHVRRMVADRPAGDRLCHGDLHLGNIITTRGGLHVIDWSQAMIGPAAADVARTELLLRYARYGRQLREHRWLRAVRHGAADWYLACYRHYGAMPDAAIEAWRLPVAVAWRRPGTAAHAPSLQRYIDDRLAREPR